MKYKAAFFLSILLSSLVHADVLIDSTTNNGGFVSANTAFNGSLAGWTATSGVWVDSGNSSLTSVPFGADSAANSRFVQVHNNAGESLTSTATFTVNPADSIDVSFDYKIGGSGADSTLTVSLWDSQANTSYAILGTINTSAAQPSFTQVDYSLSAPSANSNLQLRFSLSAGSKDIHIDRVYLAGGELTPPTPPAAIDYDVIQYLDPADTEAMKVEKAAKLLPRQKQVDWQRLETTYFIHFGPNTFNSVEWGTGFESPNDLAPTAYDATQWVSTVKNAGGKMLMLVVKHHEGFSLFPSRYTDHDISSSAWMGGAGNIVRDVSDACAAQGIKFGVYLSPADLYQIESATDYTKGSGYYGHGSTSKISNIPTNPATFDSDPTQTRTPPAGFTTYQYNADDYNRYFLNQLYELLTEYGDIAEVWFDGATPKSGPQPQAYNRHDWYDLINKLQPGANIAVKGPDVRWVGNEHGTARETEWSPIPISQHPDSYTWDDQTAADLGSRSKLVGGKYLTWWPAEVDVPVLSGWFYKPSNGVKSANDILDIYYASVGRNSNLMLNLSPDTRGLIPDNQITPLMEAMTIIQQTYATNLAAGGTMTADSSLPGQSAAKSVDGDLDTYWEPEAGMTSATLTLALASAQTIDRVVLQEAIAVRGMRIENFAVDTWNGTSWDQQATSTTVGHKRILKIPETTTDQVRVRILQSRMEPTLANVALYKSATLLASPSIGDRDGSGRVALSAAAGDSIYYTVDGSDPTTASTFYTSPVDLPMGGTVKAIAQNGGSVSFATVKVFSGYSPTGWEVISVSSEEITNGNPASNAIDDDPNTLWHTQWSGGGAHPHHITVDMQTSRWIGGFSYLPRSSGANGIIKNYRFEVSEDNSVWTNVSEAEFLNITNNPILQSVRFASPVKARYFRFTALNEVNGADFASAAEINVLPGGFDAYRQNLGKQTAAPSLDSDGDGLQLLMEYYLGTDPAVMNSDSTSLILQPTSPEFLVLRKTVVPDVTATLRSSYNLVDWFDASPVSVTPNDQGNGFTLDTYQLEPIAPEVPRVFYKIQLTQ